MEKITRLAGKPYRLLLILLASLVTVTILYDLLVPFFHVPPGSECRDYVVYDVYGVLGGSRKNCVYTGLSVDDFRSLGNLHAKRIIIVSHVFAGTAIGTSDPPSVFTPLLRPVTVFTLAKGETPDGRTYLAVLPSISRFSASLAGKQVVLISCYTKTDVVDVFRDAELVAVSNTPSLRVSDVPMLVEKTVTGNISALCGTLFTCYR